VDTKFVIVAETADTAPLKPALVPVKAAEKLPVVADNEPPVMDVAESAVMVAAGVANDVEAEMVLAERAAETDAEPVTVRAVEDIACSWEVPDTTVLPVTDSAEAVTPSVLTVRL